MKRTLLALVVLSLLCLFASASAQTVVPPPALLNFSGRIAKPDGTPVVDGTYRLRFSLWNAASAGTEKWSQTVTDITVKNGVFAVLLNVGSGFQNGTTADTLFNGDLWLETRIGDDPALTPRQQLVSVAFALKAGTVPDGSITPSKLSTEAKTAGGDLIGTYPNPTLATLETSLAKVSGGGMTSSGGSIGINTTSPRSGFPLTLRGLGTNSNLLQFRNTGGNDRWHLTMTPVGGQDGLDFVETNVAANRLYLKPGGNVGIGTNSPLARLHINPSTGGTTTGILLGSNPSTGGFTALDISLSAVSGGYAQLQAVRSSGSAWGNLILNPVAGNVGIGTVNPANRLSVAGSADITGRLGIGTTTPAYRLDVNNGDGNLAQRLLTASTVGTWLTLENTTTDGLQWSLISSGSGNGEGAGHLIFYNSQIGPNMILTRQGRLGIGTLFPISALHVNGTTTTTALNITGGGDVAEPFDVTGDDPILPGMVVSIDEKQAGKLRLSTTAYDHAVAGIISGANGVHPGVTLRQTGTAADGKYPVAMSGRVWCYADADTGGAIRPSDLLTTSATPGHAMRVGDAAGSHGAVIGKAMSALPKGKGLVLVLVNLH